MENDIIRNEPRNNSSGQDDSRVTGITRQLSGKIHILVVEDEEDGRRMICELLASPLFNASYATSLRQAQSMIEENPGGWHCWIVDLGLTDGSGLTLLKNSPDFPCKIVISGLGSMHMAYRAASEGGALAVLDKGDPSLPVSGLYSINAIAALGFLLGTEFRGNSETFLALVPRPPTSVTEWTNRCRLERRRLEQLCMKFTDKSPLKFLTLHWALTHVLGQTGLDRGRHQYDSNDDRSFAWFCLQSYFA